MFEVNYDILWKRFKKEKKYKYRISALICSLVALIGIFIGEVLFNQREQLLQNQSRYIAKEVLDLIDSFTELLGSYIRYIDIGEIEFVCDLFKKIISDNYSNSQIFKNIVFEDEFFNCNRNIVFTVLSGKLSKIRYLIKCGNLQEIKDLFRK